MIAYSGVFAIQAKLAFWDARSIFRLALALKLLLGDCAGSESCFAWAVILVHLRNYEILVAGAVFLMLFLGSIDLDDVSDFHAGLRSGEGIGLLVRFVPHLEAVWAGDNAASDGVMRVMDFDQNDGADNDYRTDCGGNADDLAGAGADVFIATGRRNALHSA